MGLSGLLMVLLSAKTPAWAQTAPEAVEHSTIAVSADQLLILADRAHRAGDLVTAETAYRALFADPSVEVRSEARFRLAMMLVGLSRLAEAATLLRAILDEQPSAQRVRLELARVLDLMGDESGARRALREAQAGGLPPDVARLVDRYSAALRAQKPVGASIDIALAPDSNINRATRSDTLGTVIGEFELDEDSRQRSGLGLTLRGQGYVRRPLSGAMNMLGRISGSADLYRASEFNDLALAISAGPELRSGADRLSLEAGLLWRWYGGAPFSRASTINANYVAFIDNRLNRLQDGQTYSASLSYEQALSNRAGIGITLAANRQSLRDPGYSSWGGQATVFAYREAGPLTLVATVSHERLRADERLLLLPKARSDQLFRASLGATFRNVRIGTFAPYARATFERNRSSTEIYDYRRVRTEFGLTRAF
jgi:tetratricopeptide (TPR) repeat protein